MLMMQQKAGVGVWDEGHETHTHTTDESVADDDAAAALSHTQNNYLES